MVLGRNKSFYLKQRLKCSCKYLTYKEWKQAFPWPILVHDFSKYLTYKEWKPMFSKMSEVELIWQRKYLTYKKYNPTGILIYLLGFTLFSQKKTAVPFRILLPFCILYTLFSFLILSTSSFITLRSIPNPFSHLFSMSLLFQIIYIICRIWTPLIW